MDFTYFLAFILTVAGLTLIVVDSSIMAKPRGWIQLWGIQWLNDLMACYQCTSTWLGFFLGALMHPFNMPWYLQMWLCGFIGSFSTVLLIALMNFLDRPWTTKNE